MLYSWLGSCTASPHLRCQFEGLPLTISILTRSILTRSILMRSTCHEINSHETNLPRNQLSFLGWKKVTLNWSCWNSFDLLVSQYKTSTDASIPQTSKKVKCFGDVSFTRLGAKEELHLLVKLLMSHALNTIVHKIRHQIRQRSWCPPWRDYLHAIKY